MHLYPLIRDLAIILGVAGVVSLLFHRIRQPVVLGYIIAGAIVGPYTPPFPLVTDIAGIKTWAELGVIFLMFSLGLEFSFRKLATVGVSAGMTAGFEVIFMLGLGYLTGQAFDWSQSDSIFLGAMLSISSTTIIIKALDELKLKTRRFAEMIFAILIVEDLIAILILVALSAFASHQAFSALALLSTAFKLVLVTGSWFMAGYFVVPRLVRYVGRFGTNEMLTLISVSLCLALAVFASYFNYSAALGAFIMGSILAESTESHRIVERLEPLRDLFAAVFFVSVGMLIDPKILWQHTGTVLLITVITIVGKIFSTTIGALLTGQNLKGSIQVGFGLAQIGEFSFIIAGLGMTSKMTSDFIYPIGVAVSILTTFTTPYLIQFSGKVAGRLEEKLPPRIQELLGRYAKWVHARQIDASQKKVFYRLLAKWFVNGILVSVIFIVSADFSLPLIRDLLPSKPMAATAASWALTVAISAPFTWAMLSALEKSKTQSEFQGIPRAVITLVLRFATLIWLGILSRAFWSLKYTILLTISLELGFLVITYRQIEKYYRWFEGLFMQTFERKEESEEKPKDLHHLAPWDAHLVRLKVHPNAPLVAHSLLESKLRDQYGINVVIIQRGEHLIVAPKPEERIFPKDELLVLGTDDQLELVRPLIEHSQPVEDHLKHITHYELKPIRVIDHTSLRSQSIRRAGIRELYGAMVVGIERAGQRIINPESDLVLENDDILWIVGDGERLAQFSKDHSK